MNRDVPFAEDFLTEEEYVKSLNYFRANGILSDEDYNQSLLHFHRVHVPLAEEFLTEEELVRELKNFNEHEFSCE